MILISVLLSKLCYVVWVCVVQGLVWDMGSGLHGVSTQSFAHLLGVSSIQAQLGVEPRTCVGSYTELEGFLHPFSPLQDFIYIIWLYRPIFSVPLV